MFECIRDIELMRIEIIDSCTFLKTNWKTNALLRYNESTRKRKVKLSYYQKGAQRNTEKGKEG